MGSRRTGFVAHDALLPLDGSRDPGADLVGRGHPQARLGTYLPHVERVVVVLVQEVVAGRPRKSARRLLEQADRHIVLRSTAGTLDLIQYVDGGVRQVHGRANLNAKPSAPDNRLTVVRGEAHTHVRVDPEILRLLGSVETDEQFQVFPARWCGRGGGRDARCLWRLHRTNQVLRLGRSRRHKQHADEHERDGSERRAHDNNPFCTRGRVIYAAC